MAEVRPTRVKIRGRIRASIQSVQRHLMQLENADIRTRTRTEGLKRVLTDDDRLWVSFTLQSIKFLLVERKGGALFSVFPVGASAAPAANAAPPLPVSLQAGAAENPDVDVIEV